MKYLIYIFLFIFISCSDNSYDEDNKHIGEWKTEYVIHWNTYNTSHHIIYSNNEIYSCSFQGTNFLLEKDNKEEIFSTTAPIEIKKSYKIQ